MDTVQTFTYVDDCIDNLINLADEKVFLIISETFSQLVIHQIHDILQINSIYICSVNESMHEKLAKEYRKVKGVFTQIESICERLKQDVYQSINDSISISFVPSTQSVSNMNLNQLDPKFMYSQLLKDILLDMEYDDAARKRFVDFYREQFPHNNQLALMDEFEKKYCDKDSVWWYTRELGFHFMVNHALRTQNTESIVKMGFFIRDLHRQIKQLHEEQLDYYMESFFLYRGQGLSIADFEMMQKSKGGLMSFNSFLSTSTNIKVSDLYAGGARQNPDLTGVVFELEINSSISSTPFAFIGNLSHFNEEKEYLFSMHTIFRICDIEPREDGLWQVKLSLTSDNDQEMKMLTEYIRRNIKDGTGLQRLGALMLEMGQYDKAIEVYEALVRATHSDVDRQAFSSVYNQLGAIYNLQGKIDKALAHYNTSLEMKLTYLSPNDPSLSPIYSNIGSALRNQNKLNEALKYMERALNIELQASQSDPLKIASYHNNIGLILTDQKKYNNALIHYEKALEIQQKCLPPSHPQLATLFNNIGTIYNELKDYDKALSCYTKSLEIMQRSLLPNHPDLATSHNNLGAIYSELEDYKKALDYYERSLNIIQQSLSSDHPSLALAYHNLSLTWYRLHFYERALTYGKKAVDIYCRAFEPNHPQLMACQETLDTIRKEL